MTIKQQGGIFGRNPSFNKVDANQVGIGLDDPKGALHVKLGAGYGAGNTWNTGSAVFGGEAATDGALGLTYNNTDGSILASIIPLVAWKPLKVHASEFSVFVNGSTNVATVDGDGLKFNGDTAAANAFDDYEKAMWTPSFGGPSSVTYTQQSGRYTKVGRSVHVQAVIAWSALTPSGAVYLNGLPFAPSAGEDYINSIPVILANGTNYTAAHQYLQGSTMYFYTGSVAGTASTNPFGSSGSIMLNGTYYN